MRVVAERYAKPVASRFLRSISGMARRSSSVKLEQVEGARISIVVSPARKVRPRRFRGASQDHATLEIRLQKVACCLKTLAHRPM
jgi:hypothetical protein